ncbi:hypothetical protein QBC42DRAFT_283058 [Cladorrhinum samala]|uniref:F-box domain-containing protein n=1 Tax=Cladorrhinum samala TaxID=585594 RepID=A0AAV9HYW7_9PEZI|nr:hypothetical protein QBC42DRAFT_283058 [Cladorrhinum samala]
MPSITELPCEIVAAILENLDHLRFLAPAALACRHFYTSFKESHGVEVSILRRQITPDVLPYSVALMEAARLPRPLTASAVRTLLDNLYNQPAGVAARLPKFPKALIKKMGRTHDAIHTLARSFARSALRGISPQSASSTSINLSPSEYFRFCSAFYRAEMFYKLFQGPAFEDNMHAALFFSRHPPWENEQLGCIYEYLEAKFAAASFDVVAHDVLFGELSIDYLRTAEAEDNEWRQTWLSHGIEFVYELSIARCYDAKRRMLESALDLDDVRVNLPEELRALYAGFDTRTIGQHSEEELHSIAPRPRDRPKGSMDPGPYQSWRNANSDSTLEESVMFNDKAWLRERAYVFWDRDRMLKLKHEDGFGQDPGSKPAYTDQDYQDMLESFEKRSRIWQ